MLLEDTEILFVKHILAEQLAYFLEIPVFVCLPRSPKQDVCFFENLGNVFIVGETSIIDVLLLHLSLKGLEFDCGEVQDKTVVSKLLPVHAFVLDYLDIAFAGAFLKSQLVIMFEQFNGLEVQQIVAADRAGCAVMA